MSYNSIPTFESNRMGIRRLSALSGAGVMLGGLGDTAATAQVLISQGYDPGVINTLVAMGATDAQLTDILNGVNTTGGLMNQLTQSSAPMPTGLTPPGSGIMPSAAVNPSAPPVAPVSPASYSIPVAQVPNGSTLLYQVAYSQTLLTLANLTLPASSVAAQLAAQLPQYGMAVMQSTVTDNGPQTFAINFSIRITGNGFAQQNDVYSILHNLMVKIVGNTITADPLSLVSTSATPNIQGNLQNPSAVASAYWPWIVGGAVGLFAIGILRASRR
jgi:hypothetical protein